MIRNKARLVAKGYLQIPGVSFTLEFSAVSKYTTVCLMIAIAETFGCVRELVDVKKAFVNTALK